LVDREVVLVHEPVCAAHGSLTSRARHAAGLQS
jgi:hypothetical protein